MVSIFRTIAHEPDGELYRSLLPIAGVSGTLASRFVNTTAQGIVQAKDGTMTGVSALSGYIQPPGFMPLVFSMIVNFAAQPTSVIEQGTPLAR